MNSYPLVSIYIPTHNRSSLLSTSLLSLVNQDYKNIEIIVCDDGSTDDTHVIVSQFINEYPNRKIIYVKNEKPKGACLSRNRCIERASGDYITGLDDDDYFTLNRISLFVDYANSTGKKFLCSNFIFKDNNREKNSKKYTGDITFDDMSYKNMIGNQVFAPTSFFKDLGGFDVTFPAWQDFELWYRMVKAFGPCFKIPEATYVMNVDSNRKRITTSGNAHHGYSMFIKKHRGDLSEYNLNSLCVCDLINRNQIIPINMIIDSVRFNGFYSCVKHNLRMILPFSDYLISKLRR